jgi:hypothetical protein
MISISGIFVVSLIMYHMHNEELIMYHSCYLECLYLLIIMITNV